MFRQQQVRVNAAAEPHTELFVWEKELDSKFVLPGYFPMSLASVKHSKSTSSLRFWNNTQVLCMVNSLECSLLYDQHSPLHNVRATSFHKVIFSQL